MIAFLALATTLGTTAVVPAPQDPCVVLLTSPAQNAVLPQNQLAAGKVETRWRFAWSGCPGATRYHLIVSGPKALNPIVDLDTIRQTSHEQRSTHFGITELKGWTWKVRAFVNGAWTGWSGTGSFDVAPPKAATASTCSVSGTVNGNLIIPGKDDRGQRITFELKEMFMRPAGGGEVLRARIVNRAFTFRNLPAGSYTLFPERFQAAPKERTVTCEPGRPIPNQNFTITGAPRVG